jgi:hypothetical protein
MVVIDTSQLRRYGLINYNDESYHHFKTYHFNTWIYNAYLSIYHKKLPIQLKAKSITRQRETVAKSLKGNWRRTARNRACGEKSLI